MMKSRSAANRQRLSVLYTIMAFVFLLVVFQLWLITGALEAALSREANAVASAALASFGCFLGNCVLLRQLFKLDGE